MGVAIVAALAEGWPNGFFPSDLIDQTLLSSTEINAALVLLYSHNRLERLSDNLYKLT